MTREVNFYQTAFTLREIASFVGDTKERITAEAEARWDTSDPEGYRANRSRARVLLRHDPTRSRIFVRFVGTPQQEERPAEMPGQPTDLFYPVKTAYEVKVEEVIGALRLTIKQRLGPNSVRVKVVELDFLGDNPILYVERDGLLEPETTIEMEE